MEGISYAAVVEGVGDSSGLNSRDRGLEDIPFREPSMKFGRPAIIMSNVEIARIS